MAKDFSKYPSPNFTPPPVLNSGPPVWSSYEPIWTNCSACLPPTGQLQDLPIIQHKALQLWFNGSIAILDPLNHPYPNTSTAMTTFQSKRLGEYLVDVALVTACDAVCSVKTDGHAWDFRFAVTPLLDDILANLARAQGIIDQINLKTRPAAGRTAPSLSVLNENSIIANVYQHYIGTAAVSYPSTQEGIDAVTDYLVQEFLPIVRALHDEIMDTHYECYTESAIPHIVASSPPKIDLEETRAWVKEKDLPVMEHFCGYVDGPRGKMQTHCTLLGTGHKQLLIGFGEGVSKVKAEQAAYAEAISHERIPGYKA